MTIVGIVFTIVLLIVLFKVLKNIVSFALSAAGILILTYLVIAGLRYADKQDLRNNLQISNNLILVEDSGNIISGFATKGGEVNTDNINVHDEDLYKEYYKVIIIPKEMENLSTKRLLNVDTLIQKEKDDKIKVYRESIAFRHGLEVLKI